jgi:hypothetical protein
MTAAAGLNLMSQCNLTGESGSRSTKGTHDERLSLLLLLDGLGPPVRQSASAGLAVRPQPSRFDFCPGGRRFPGFLFLYA